MEKNYFFVDGSSLLSDVANIKKRKAFHSKKLDLCLFIESFVNTVHSYLGIKSYKRFVFYFVYNETRIKKDLILPQVDTPGVVSDMHIQYCGKKVKGGASV